MTDAELLKLCGDAMGYQSSLREDGTYGLLWDPLTNDQQAMSLVKALEMDVLRSGCAWHVSTIKRVPASQRHVDLNRAIVICAAKTQLFRERTSTEKRGSDEQAS